MAKKSKKSLSTSLAVREMQNKMQSDSVTLSLRKAKLERTDKCQCWQRCAIIRILISDNGSVNWYNHFGKLLAVSVKTKDLSTL